MRNKAKLSIVLLISFFLVGCGETSSNCVIDNDKFTGEESINCEGVNLTIEEQGAEVVHKALGSFNTAKGQRAILLTTRSEDWNYLDNEKAHVLIDGERMQFPVMQIRKDIDDKGGFLEQNALLLSEMDTQKIARAKTFKVKYGGTVFNMNPIILQASQSVSLMRDIHN